MSKLNLSWTDVEIAVQNIANYYEHQKFDLIVGLSRGGLIPATILSHKLNIPLVPLEWQTRDFGVKDLEKIVELKANIWGGSKVLVVDDIYDSGKTYREIKEHLKCEYTTIITKQNFKGFSPIELTGDAWIIFPWE